MTETIIKIIVDEFTDTTTQGKMYINGRFFGYTLEDASRAYGIKIPGKTCIPQGLYKVKVNYSPKFQKELPIIYTGTGGFKVKKGGIEFQGIRFHGGNDHEDTEGCILIAKNREKGKIWGSLSDELTKILKEKGGTATLIKTQALGRTY